MKHGSAVRGELEAVLEPLRSLISKSVKARRGLPRGSWQHAMLSANVKALRTGVSLLAAERAGAEVTEDDLRDALRSFAAMIRKSASAKAGFARGSSQHSLQRNRLRALRAAARVVKADLARRTAGKRK